MDNQYEDSNSQFDDYIKRESRRKKIVIITICFVMTIAISLSVFLFNYLYVKKGKIINL